MDLVFKEENEKFNYILTSALIKCHYYFGTGCWWWFLVVGIAALAASVAVGDVMWSSLLGVFAFSSFWTIKEVFEQEQRVRKGWFPSNPKRKQ